MAEVVPYKQRRKGRGEALTEDELKALIASEINSSVSYQKTDLQQKRADALDMYNGKIPGLATLPGRSTYVDRAVSDTIGWMLPGIIRVFTASERMVQYNPVGKGDEDFAEEASDYCNHIFWKDNDGYRVLWNATWDSLTQGNGIVKSYWDASETCEYSVHSGMTEEDIAILLSAEDGNPVEITAQRQGAPFLQPDPNWQPDPEMPESEPPMIEVPTWDIKLERTVQTGRVVVECIAPEDFFLDAEARTVDEARFMGHRAEKTRSELIEMGFDAEVVEELPADRGSRLLDSEKLSRDEDSLWTSDAALHASMQLIELWEVYIRVDVDGDGKSEMVRAYYAGSSTSGVLLEWEEWDDDYPMQDIPCEPVPHRWDARSVTDETGDIQKIKTVLTRQMVDNLYATNIPQREVEQNTVVNPEALTIPKFGGIIWRTKGAMAASPIVTHAIPFVADKALMGLEFFDQQIEKRTGVSRSTMALDPETLQNQTATATQKQTDASYSQVELIARNQAELGWKKVFRNILKLVVKHQDRPRQIRLKEDWVNMDPRFWNSEMDCDINVGLGTGSRDRDMQMLMQIGMVQKEIMAGFAQGGLPDEALDMMPRIVRTATKLAESSGIRDPEGYFPDVSEERMAEIKQKQAEALSQPDPKVVAEQQQAQLEAQSKAQSEALELQFKEKEATLKAQVDVLKEDAQMQADLRVKAAEMEKDAFIEQMNSRFEEWQTKYEERLKLVNSDADRDLKWKIALLQAGAKDKGNGEAEDAHDVRHRESQQSLAQLAGMVEQIAQKQNAPSRKRIRTPEGRELMVEDQDGVRKVRSQDGREYTIENLN